MVTKAYNQTYILNNNKNKKKKKKSFEYAYKKRRNLKLLRRKKRKIIVKKDNKTVTHTQDFLKFIKKTSFRKRARFSMTNDKVAIINIPKVFSLIKNPDDAIAVYNKIFNVFYKNELNGVYFDHSHCDELEIGASTVMDVFVMNLERFMKLQGRDFSVGGLLPKDDKNKTTLIVSGIIKHLNFPDDERKRIMNEYSGQIRSLDLISGGKNSLTYKVNPYLSSPVVATRVADYFEECLATQELGINQEGKSYIAQLVGETINNCQLHSGDFSQFYTLGHYYSEKGAGFGECQLVIFNFGQTIYEGLKNAKDPQTVNDLNNLSKLHIEKGFFNLNDWDEEVLWTLYALQDGVSRAKSIDDPDRGTGTVTLIESFQNIGSTMQGKKPEMSIISGSAYIKFDGKYKIKNKGMPGGNRDIIAFNENNNLEEPPDKRYVKKIKNYFPGTVICLDFYIDKQYIISLKEEKNNGNQFK